MKSRERKYRMPGVPPLTYKAVVLALAGALMASGQARGQCCPGAGEDEQGTRRMVAQPVQVRDCPAESGGTFRWLKGKRSATVPFTLSRNLVHLRAKVNNVKGAELILDTGMPAPGALLFGSGRLKGLKADFSGRAAVQGAGGGQAAAKMATGLAIAIGDLVLEEQQAMYIPGGAGGLRLDADGVIGYEIFSRFVVSIDYDRMEITFAEPGGYGYGGKGTVLPLELTGNFPYLKCEATAEDGSKHALDMVLDLGAAHALSLNLESLPGLALPERTVDFWARGLGSEINGKAGRIKRLEIGPYSLEGTVAHFYPKSIAPCERHGNLGSGAIRRFNLVLDYTRKQLILEPNSRFSDPFKYNMAGLHADPGQEGMTVRHVLPGSPSDEAGVVEGDLITRADGKPTRRMTIDTFSDMLQAEGATVVLDIRRSGQKVRAEVKLRRLI